MKRRLKYIGENIRIARQNRGLSIEQLAEAADLSESFLGLVERSVSGLSIESLIDITSVLEISTDSILMDKLTPQNPPSNSDILITLIKNSSDNEVDYMLDMYKLMKRHRII